MGLEVFDYKVILALIAALISFSNLVFYVLTIFNGKTKPHFYTWFIWALISFVVGISQILNDAGFGGYYTLLVAFNCTVISLLAFFKSGIKAAKSDHICLILCIFATSLWPITSTPIFSVILLTMIDMAGFIPTARKSYNAPHEENIFTFSIHALTWSLSIVALKEYNSITLIYPIAMVLAPIALVIFIALRRYKLGYKIIQ